MIYFIATIIWYGFLGLVALNILSLIIDGIPPSKKQKEEMEKRRVYLNSFYRDHKIPLDS